MNGVAAMDPNAAPKTLYVGNLEHQVLYSELHMLLHWVYFP
jgi:hypothetical protein